jgi:allophanate hydrolase subunit 1
MRPAGVLGALRAWLGRPRIVHGLPGRLRLHLPALRALDPGQRDWLVLWQEALGDLPGIRAVELNPTTGSVLIRYDPARLTEQELVGFLHAVNRIVLRHWDRLAAIPPERLPEAVRQLVDALRAATRHSLALDETIEMRWDA